MSEGGQSQPAVSTDPAPPLRAAADAGGPRQQHAATTDRTLVSLSAVTWDFALVGRTRMLTDAWLQAGQDTLFVQVPSFRTALQRVRAGLRDPQQPPVVRPWPTYPSRFWPVLPEKTLRAAIRHRAEDLRRQLEKRVDLDKAVALVVSPVWAPWLEHLPFRHVVYDCIDDPVVHTPSPRLGRLYRKWEDELLQRASGAVVTAEPLRTHLAQRDASLKIATIRNGVDSEAFERTARESPRPADLPPGERPIVGFVGALYEWIDWPLIRHVVAALPQYDFVFVGPHDGNPALDAMQQRSNVFLLGPRPYALVPAYMQAFDVCWVPFDRSSISRAANPVKIYEYLALGKPVVTTPVADVESFGRHVLVGRSPSEVSDALQLALKAADTDVEARVAFARANSWSARAADYASFAASL